MAFNIAEHIDAILAGMGGIGTTVLAWKQGKKNVESSYIENVQKVATIWEATAEKLNTKVTAFEGMIETLKKNHEECEESKKKLEAQVKCLDGKVCELTEAMHNVIQTPKPKRKGYNSAKSDQ